MVERFSGVPTALFLFFLILPFQFALGATEGIDLAMSRIGAIAIGIFFLAERLRNGSWILPLKRDLFFFIGFFCLAGLSLVFAGEPSWTARKILFLLSFSPLYFVFTDIFSRGGAPLIGYIGKGFFFGSVVAAVVSLLQFVSQFIFSIDQVLSFWLSRIYPIFLGEAFAHAVTIHPSLLVNIAGKTILRAVGVFPDPHVAAYYFGMAIPFGWWFGMRAAKSKKAFFFLGTGILFLADLCTFSRGGYVGILSILVFFGAFSFFRMQVYRSFQQKKKAIVTVLLIIALSLAAPPVRSRLVETLSLTEGSNSARIALWSEALTHIGERPLLGYGLGNYPLKVKPSADYREPIYIHNIYLDMAAELGIIGLLFFLGIFFLPASIFFVRGSFSSIALPVTLALILFLSHSLFENTLFSVHVFPVLLFLIAAIAWYNRGDERQ
jgi:O-antigen ligase